MFDNNDDDNIYIYIYIHTYALFALGGRARPCAAPPPRRAAVARRTL